MLLFAPIVRDQENSRTALALGPDLILAPIGLAATFALITCHVLSSPPANKPCSSSPLSSQRMHDLEDIPYKIDAVLESPSHTPNLLKNETLVKIKMPSFRDMTAHDLYRFLAPVGGTGSYFDSIAFLKDAIVHKREVADTSDTDDLALLAEAIATSSSNLTSGHRTYHSFILPGSEALKGLTHMLNEGGALPSSQGPNTSLDKREVDNAALVHPKSFWKFICAWSNGTVCERKSHSPFGWRSFYTNL